ncbi:MAG: radical SAM protein [Brevinematales bacterium]|nr:radical SAM protein [Brevinematales bacterium]
MRKNILLINPYIEDFSAYDHFSKPLGLIWLSSYLKEHFNVYFINALNRLYQKVKFKPDGTGDFPKRKIPAPENLKDIPRDFKRYGIDEGLFLQKLKEIEKPDYIFITSGMTYWYTGIQYTISLIKEVYSNIPIFLGGIYATILPNHAKREIDCDYVIPNQNIDSVLDELEKLLGVNFTRELKLPDYEILGEYYYLPILTSTGCVFNCSYCIGHKLSSFKQFDPIIFAILIKNLKDKYGCKNFAFYDDALLVNSEKHVIPFLEKIIEYDLNINFYTPNGLHIKYLTPTIAKLMKKSGFVDIRLSLESIDEHFQVKKGNKTSKEEFKKAMEILYNAGFTKDNIKVYTLLNIPEADNTSIEKTMEWIYQNGGQPMLAFYSPIPGTKDFEKASKITPLDEPLFQNNTVYLYRSRFDMNYFQYLKTLENRFKKA